MSFNPERDFDIPRSFNPQLNLSGKHGLTLKCRCGLKFNPDACKLLVTRQNPISLSWLVFMKLYPS